ncbi:MAG: hypothetical protein QM820_03150, partial [Minicystis sp.]
MKSIRPSSYGSRLVLGSLAASIGLAAACSATTNTQFTTGTGGNGGQGAVTTGVGASTSHASGTGGDVIFTDGGIPSMRRFAAPLAPPTSTRSSTATARSSRSAAAIRRPRDLGLLHQRLPGRGRDRQSVGCEYYATNMDQFSNNVCFAAFVANTWNTPAHLNVEFAGRAQPGRLRAHP